MSIQSIKIKIGNETKELTLEEARELKDSLDEFFENRSIKESLDKLIDRYRPVWIPPCTVAPKTAPWITPSYDPMKPYCATQMPSSICTSTSSIGQSGEYIATNKAK